MQKVLQGWLELWELRNGDQHGRDHQTRAQADKAQALHELEQLHSYKDQIEPRYAWILATPMEQRMALKTHALRAFINNFEHVVQRSYQTQLETG